MRKAVLTAAVLSALVAPAALVYAQGEQQTRFVAPRTDEDKLKSFTDKQQPALVTIEFSGVRPDAAVRTILEQASAKPRKIFMVLDGMAGFHSVANGATGDVIAEARSVSVKQFEESEQSYGKGLRQLLADQRSQALEGPKLEFLRDTLRRSEQNQRMLNGFRNGRPIIYAVQANLTAEGIATLRANPQVGSVQIGYVAGNGQAVAPTPDLPSDYRPGFQSATLKAMNRDQLLGQARAKIGGQ